jgi:hypothetical protein
MNRDTLIQKHLEAIEHNTYADCEYRKENTFEDSKFNCREINVRLASESATNITIQAQIDLLEDLIKYGCFCEEYGDNLTLELKVIELKKLLKP